MFEKFKIWLHQRLCQHEWEYHRVVSAERQAILRYDECAKCEVRRVPNGSYSSPNDIEQDIADLNSISAALNTAP